MSKKRGKELSSTDSWIKSCNGIELTDNVSFEDTNRASSICGATKPGFQSTNCTCQTKARITTNQSIRETKQISNLVEGLKIWPKHA